MADEKNLLQPEAEEAGAKEEATNEKEIAGQAVPDEAALQAAEEPPESAAAKAEQPDEKTEEKVEAPQPDAAEGGSAFLEEPGVQAAEKEESLPAAAEEQGAEMPKEPVVAAENAEVQPAEAPENTVQEIADKAGEEQPAEPKPQEEPVQEIEKESAEAPKEPVLQENSLGGEEASLGFAETETPMEEQPEEPAAEKTGEEPEPRETNPAETEMEKAAAEQAEPLAEQEESPAEQEPPQQEDIAEAVTIMAPSVSANAAEAEGGGDDAAPRSEQPPAKERRKPVPKTGQEPEKEPSVVLLFFGNAFRFIFKFLFVCVCLVALAGSVAAVKVSEYMVEATANDADLLDLDTLKLAQTSYIMALNPDNPNAREENDWIPYQELTGPQEHRIWVPLNEIPDDLIHAVIAIEDREFYDHHGVSFKRTFYALVNELLGIEDGTFGASTIDQQLVKNLTGDKVVMDEEGDMTTGYQRKLREIFRAWGLNNRYSKDMILEAYLNTMALSEMIAGVQAGAQDYFNKDVGDLTLAECATIAGITRAPTYYSPFQNPENSLNRRNSVLKQMWETGYITEEQYRQEKEKPLGLQGKQTQAEKEAAGNIFSYYSDAVIEDVIRDLGEKKGFDRREALNYIYTEGLRIECSVDWNMQRYVEDLYESGYNDDGFFTNQRDARGRDYKTYLSVEVKDDEGNVEEVVLPQSSVAIIDYDGALKAVAGGIGEKEQSLGLNRATQSVRQVGSTMKPIAAYALGIDYGYIDYGSSIVDSGVRNRDGRPAARDPETGVANFNWPRNFSGRYRNTGMPVVSAIAESTNTVAVKVGQIVGVQEMFEFLRDTLQITSLVEEGPANDMDLGPLVLGSLTDGISPYELAGAYMMFGNGGVFNSLHTYERVRDSNGNIVMEPEIISMQAISEETSFIMNRMLWTVVNGGAPGVSSTARGMAPAGEMPAVAKTGTTSDDKDRWFVGLTPYYVTAVWWGYDYNYSLERWSPAASGNIPPNVWKNIMEYAQQDLEYREFPAQPEGVVQASFCLATGNLAGGGCSSAVGYYNSNVRIPPTCGGHAPPPAEGEEAPPEG